MEETKTRGQNTHPEGGSKSAGNASRPWPIAFLTSWSPGRKWALGITGCACAIIALVLIQQGRFFGYRLLFGNLTHFETAAIASLLDDYEINYRLKNDGADIWVPAKHVHSARLALAQMQLPEGSSGNHQLFDERGLQLTNVLQEVERSALLQRELSRTISSLRPIASARVALTAPSQTDAEFPKSGPSASVFVSLLPGSVLSEQNINTIIHLMSAAVNGLRAEDISIIDSRGSVLKDSSPFSAGIPASEDILSFQHRVEKRLEARIQPLLDRILGSNRAVVKIAAQLDLSKTEQTIELFDPTEPVVKSEHSIEEPAGVSGAGKNENTVTYEISKTTSRVTSPVGRIEGLTVSILVDPSIASGSIDAAQPKLDEAMLLAIEKMLSSTISFNAERGDQLHLITVPLGGSADSPAAFESTPANLLYDYLPAARFVLVLLGFVALYFLLIRPLVKTIAGDYGRQPPSEEQTHAYAYKAEHVPDLEYAAHVQEEVLQNPSPTVHIIKKWIQDT